MLCQIARLVAGGRYRNLHGPACSLHALRTGPACRGEAALRSKPCVTCFSLMTYVIFVFRLEFNGMPSALWRLQPNQPGFVPSRSKPPRRMIMCCYSWNKSIAVSSALAAAGVLTCAAAFLDTLVPKESPAAFLASMALLGLAVTGAVIGFTWACDRIESHLDGRLDRLLSTGKAGGNAAPASIHGKKRLGLKIISDRVTAPNAAKLPVSRGWNMPALRGTDSPKDRTTATASRIWNGQ